MTILSIGYIRYYDCFLSNKEIILFFHSYTLNKILSDEKYIRIDITL